MDCEEFLAGYSDFLDRKFERHPLANYCEHLLRCTSCGEYDRVVRRGLQVVRQLEPPEPRKDFVSRVHRRIVSRARSIAPRDGRGWLGTAVAAAAVGLIVVTTISRVGEDSEQVELPPVVVEPRSQEPEVPSLFGPAPRFRPETDLFTVPSLAEESFFAFPSEPLSLFRTPLNSVGATTVTRHAEVASPR
jgi:hypothetical protein